MLKTAAKTTSVLGIKQCRLEAYLGVLPQEKLKPQEVWLTLSLEANIEASFSSDSLEDTIDYRDLLDTCKEKARERHYNLIENLASALLDAIEERFPLLSAEILLEKPGALAEAKSSFVTLKRRFDA